MQAKHPSAGGAKARPWTGKSLARTLLDATSDLAMLIALDGEILAVNAAMARLFRLTPSQMEGERIYDFLPLPVAATYAEAVRQAVATGTPQHFEDSFFQNMAVQTHIHPVLPAPGEEAAAAVFCHDVSERRSAERERTRLASAIEQTADAVILYEEDMRVAYVNQSFEAMTGYSLHEVRGKDAETFYVGPEQQRSLGEIRAALAQGDPWTGKADNTCKDGSVIRCDKTVSVIRGKGGCILGYVSVWRDITEVEALGRQLRHAQKMEAIGTLAGGIAHDFNNILAPIFLLADIGLCELAKGDPLRSVFERILKAAQRGGGLVKQILGLSQRYESDRPIPFRLSTILRECLKLLRPSLPSCIDIRVSQEVQDDVILADPSQLHQLVMNLCTNAAWAMRGAGGTLHFCITARRVPDDGDPAFRAAGPGEYVLFSVGDTGHGISAEHLDHIFDPFFTTKRDGSGTGLGLAVVWNIVDRLGGDIRVRSEPDRGARFDILLPLSHDAAVDVTEREERQGLMLAGSERILVVDDEPEILDACAAGLSALGYTVTTQTRGENARDLFKADPHAFDLMLTDATMPGLSGPELVREVLKLNPHLPVILTTGHSELVTREKAWRLGAMEFLGKPYRIDELAALIRRLLDGRRHGGPEREE